MGLAAIFLDQLGADGSFFPDLIYVLVMSDASVATVIANSLKKRKFIFVGHQYNVYQEANRA